uniref:Uncharacterized protein n=1 Tax=Glossina pallidipes TaxID=7398 RepID=A0A1A9ZAN3_GLOPL
MTQIIQISSKYCDKLNGCYLMHYPGHCKFLLCVQAGTVIGCKENSEESEFSLLTCLHLKQVLISEQRPAIHMATNFIAWELFHTTLRYYGFEMVAKLHKALAFGKNIHQVLQPSVFETNNMCS